MAPANILHMSVGHGDSSYDNNSLMQEIVIQNTLPFLKHSIKGMANNNVFLDHCFMIADLGCSYGTNTLLVASNIINTVTEVCKENNYKPPQFQVSLNDLFGNDFNNLFKLLPDFYAKLMKEKGENFGPCFVSAVPGSFYDRLFPDQSLHLVHSSYSIHWLSQVPEHIENNALNIYVAKDSPPNVFQEYAKQFHTDFTNFLKLRSKEIVCGGCMVLTLLGRSIADSTSDDACDLWEQLAQSLRDMLEEGSFSFDSSIVFQGNWDPQDTDYTNTKDLIELSHNHGRNTAKVVKAVIEPLLTSHFGNSIIDTLFKNHHQATLSMPPLKPSIADHCRRDRAAVKPSIATLSIAVHCRRDERRRTSDDNGAVGSGGGAGTSTFWRLN
ncbi:hypothetical protein E3N88_37130 [Mikania micrantha]|uniref:Jasmonate O-methyltransferase n=1 Tax=Mikania micrantha TaxID=192012 RepID=A0A5N6M5J8_9ASTR|nr:hypothetical protein E3N88_37130 [Mikania micrantha]